MTKKKCSFAGKGSAEELTPKASQKQGKQKEKEKEKVKEKGECDQFTLNPFSERFVELPTTQTAISRPRPTRASQSSKIRDPGPSSQIEPMSVDSPERPPSPKRIKRDRSGGLKPIPSTAGSSSWREGSDALLEQMSTFSSGGRLFDDVTMVPVIPSGLSNELFIQAVALRQSMMDRRGTMQGDAKYMDEMRAQWRRLLGSK